MSTLDPLVPYVRFYLTVVRELDGVIASLAQAEASAREALTPYADALSHAEPAPPPGALTTASLWRPSDPEGFTGLVDVYEVVGRFTFQGEDDANLRAVSAVIASLRNEVARQRVWHTSLREAPAKATAHAEGLYAKDLESTRAQQSELLKQFEPVAATLGEQCQRVLDAIRAHKRPDLAKLETADTLYQDYVRRIRTLYATALPYLRKELAELCQTAGCEVPPSWPDALPFAPSLPPELLEPPPSETQALAQARHGLATLASQETALARAQDELGVQLRRVEGEAASLTQRETELLKEANAAKTVVRWATKLEELDAARAQASGLQDEGTRRTRAVAELAAQQQQVTLTLQTLQAEATELVQGLGAKRDALEKLKGDEPFLGIGKGEWQRKVAELASDLEETRKALTQRQQAMSAGNAELAQWKGREQAEQAQIAALGRAHSEARAREAGILKEIMEIEQELGATRPASRVSSQQAQEHLALIWNARNEVRARIDRMGAEARRIKEDSDRVGVQLKQLTVEKQKLQPDVAQAAQAASAAHEEAVKALANRRQAAFESHASSVLAGLEESLSQVDRIFVEPARRVLLERAGVVSPAPGALRTQATALETALQASLGRAEEALSLQVSALDRLQREFVERAPEACARAWGG